MLTAALILAVVGVGEAPPAQPPEATPANVRAAVQRSLPDLERGGTAWMAERKCNSCHVVTFMVWAHNEAAAAGLDVDRAKLAEWNRWALADAMSERRWFKLRPWSIDALKAAGMAAEQLRQLQPLVGKTYLTRGEYVVAVEKALGAEAVARHGELLVREATLPNDGGGPDTLSQLLLGRVVAGPGGAGGRVPEELADSYERVRALLLEWQAPDGSWAAAGQLPSMKWGSPAEMNRVTTMWALLAAGGGDAAPSRRRAAEFLRGSTPGATVSSLALCLMVARELGDGAAAEDLCKSLLARQNADGGWSWMAQRNESDAFATGQALYALGRVGRDGTDPSVGRAWGFLLRTQGEDGAWQVPQEALNTRPRKLNVYPYWGTAWADIGLLRTLPVVNGPATAAP